MEDRRRELEELAREIARHEFAYRAGRPEILDSEFDELSARYEALADDLGIPVEERLDQRPGADHTDGFVEVEHRVPMLSLEKLSPSRRGPDGSGVPLVEQLRSWCERRRRDLELSSTDDLPLVVEPKIDGISVSLFYSGGRLARAVTRGDGLKGDDITRQVRAAKAVPGSLRGVTGSLEVRGELYWPREAFGRFNEARERAGKETFANPRNGCAGLMKRKATEDLEGAGVSSFLYQVPWAEEIRLPSRQSEVLAWLADCGGHVYSSEVAVVRSPEEASAHCDRFAARRRELGYEIDGLVIKLEELRYYDQLVGTDHHPHWAIAYKFPPERKPTKLLAIKVQVGKSGTLTPVAELEPVELSGTTVSRASLHNFVELDRKDIRVGDTVLVEKAGEIIPQVVGVELKERPPSAKHFERPSTCPSCGSSVLSSEVFVFCPNPSCPEQVQERLRHFCSRDAMDIEGLGPERVGLIIASLGVRSPVDLFTLTREQLASSKAFRKQDGGPKKDVDKLIRAIDAARSRGLERLLTGLALRHVGTAMAEELARYFHEATALVAFAKRYASGDGSAIELVAPAAGSGVIAKMARKTADSIFSELASEAVQNTLDGLARAGVRMEYTGRPVKGIAAFEGKSFVLTGTLPSLDRAEAAERIRTAGGKVASSVSQKTDVVVAGDNAGSKLARAIELGIPIWNERDLLNHLDDIDAESPGAEAPEGRS